MSNMRVLQQTACWTSVARQGHHPYHSRPAVPSMLRIQQHHWQPTVAAEAQSSDSDHSSLQGSHGVPALVPVAPDSTAAGMRAMLGVWIPSVVGGEMLCFCSMCLMAPFCGAFKLFLPVVGQALVFSLAGSVMAWCTCLAMAVGQFTASKRSEGSIINGSNASVDLPGDSEVLRSLLLRPDMFIKEQPSAAHPEIQELIEEKKSQVREIHEHTLLVQQAFHMELESGTLDKHSEEGYRRRLAVLHKQRGKLQAQLHSLIH